jgi:hypothetical protein
LTVVKMVFVTAALFVGFVGLASVACSTSNSATAGAADAGSPDVQPRPAPADDGAAPMTCREGCEQDHPNGIAKDRAVVVCWQTSCAATCIDGAPSDAGTDGGDGGADASTPDASLTNAGPSCQQPVVTNTSDCDTCTKASCCVPWDACFGDTECAALNACYTACPP